MSVIDLTTRRLPAKPTIQWDAKKQLWACHDNYYICGHGATPYAAWANWKIKEQKRTRIPRAGFWNRKSCYRWFRDGCYLIRTYIGGQQIIGFDPSTDELILRG